MQTTIEELNWEGAIEKAYEELNTLRKIEVMMGPIVTIREIIIEGALKLYANGERSIELFELLNG